ncbi:MAG TPA: hypothetical protein VFA27_03465 [Vicinamibacterales bacterium]|nr:hypothetical protein [Vicinamibacterales bacterium]
MAALASIVHKTTMTAVRTGTRAVPSVSRMPLIPLLLTAMLAAAPPADQASTGQDAPLNLPVSLDKIRAGLEETPTTPTLRGLNEVPTFKVEVHETHRPFTLEELVKSLAPGFKAGPVPAGGVYAYELNRVTNDPVANPLTQPYAPFNQPELLTVLVENLAGQYLGGKAINAVTTAERAHAEAEARDEVRRAVADYCSAQPDGGRGIEICKTPIQ